MGHPINQMGGIYAMHIDNGVDCNCENNVLVFSDWETFRTMSDLLESQWDQHVAAFSENVEGMTEAEIQAYANSIAYNQEQPYLDFEAAYQFASLRKKIFDEETAWLASIDGPEDWIAKNDPDNHYIWYENRVLLNEQVEVIVKDSLNNNVIYKFYEGGYVTIMGSNYEILREFNESFPPNPDPNDPPPATDPPVGTPIKYYAYNNSGVPPLVGSPTPWDNFPFFKVAPIEPEPCENCVPGGPAPDPTPPCNGKDVHRQYFQVPESGYWIKTVDKFKSDKGWWFFSNEKVKTKTKHYRTSGSNMTRYKAWITADLEAVLGIQCGTGNIPSPKTKRAYTSKIKVKWDQGDLNHQDPNLTPDNVYATRKINDPDDQNHLIKKIDIFDGTVQ